MSNPKEQDVRKPEWLNSSSKIMKEQEPTGYTPTDENNNPKKHNGQYPDNNSNEQDEIQSS